MTCSKCGDELIERKVTAETPYHYKSSGLKSVYLVGIVLRRCPKCRGESAVIPRMGQLHQTIARVLLRKLQKLTGDELRFLRKHAGFSASEFAAQLQVDPATLSRFENDKQGLGESAEKLARAIVIAGIQKVEQNESLRQFLLRKQRLPDMRGRQSTRYLRYRRSRWRAEAA